MSFFIYGETEINYLSGKCQKLGRVIELIGPLERAVTPDLFESLMRSIVGQQISSKAQATVWARIKELVGEITPQNMAACPADALQKCGMSMRKTDYIQQTACAVLDGHFDMAALHDMSDIEVRRHLSALKGIGEWTAEMLMLFSMQRPDILSYGDLAIRRGLCMLHRHRELTPALFERYRKRYSPYGSVASLYIWALAGGEVEGF